MNVITLTSIPTIKALLSSHGLALKKNLGQNFLINDHVLEKIIAEADIKPEDTVLEIGAGIGTLTCKLAEKTPKVIAVEKDFALIPLLRETLDKNQLLERVTILEDDALRIDPPNTPYKIVANIPYFITSPLINHFLKKAYCHCEHARSEAKCVFSAIDRAVPAKAGKQSPYTCPNVIARSEFACEADERRSGHPSVILSGAKDLSMPAGKQSPCASLKTPPRPPTLMILMIQKEVAEKISAREGKLNMLAINTQTFADVKTLFHVKSGNFYPQPKVDSAVIQIKPLEAPRVQCNLLLYFKIISAGFQSKRKNLANALSRNLNIPKETTENWLLSCEISPKSRAETLTFKQWEKLTLSFRVTTMGQGHYEIPNQAL